MCLYLKNSDERQPKVAEKDITAFKILFDTTNESPYEYYKYEPEKEYSISNIDWEISRSSARVYREVSHGYHTFKCGFMAHNYGLDNIFAHPWKIVEFVIPAGAEYFEGDRGDLVSNRIRTKSLEAVKEEQDNATRSV